MDLCKFEASLVYDKVSSRTTRSVTQKNPVSERKVCTLIVLYYLSIVSLFWGHHDVPSSDTTKRGCGGYSGLSVWLYLKLTKIQNWGHTCERFLLKVGSSTSRVFDTSLIQIFWTRKPIANLAYAFCWKPNKNMEEGSFCSLPVLFGFANSPFFHLH